ncbi:MAG: protein kinase [Planctomycetales bacterium]|nr:protein kinase [Planctomycetales bacterium]
MPAFRYQNGDRPLDGFTIQRGLGRGGFGEVYYALSDSGRQVALKVVQNYEDVELRGIGHCMNLKSQHLVSIFDVKFNDRQEPFVIMEYVDGPSLRQLLDETPNGLGATKAAFFIRELAKGITYLHDHGIVHRDMKPHNVFFEEGIVKIGDYSLSKIISTSHRSGHTMTVGTVHYMAPEIGMGKYDARVDIYALGIMLYEMLTGKPPFVGESMGEVIMKHVTAEPDLTGIEQPYARTIKKALAKDPANRFQTAAEMVESLFGADHVKNSVTAFNPMELSIVAEKVAQKVTAQPIPTGGSVDGGGPGGGSGKNDMFLSPAAVPTEVYGRSSDSTKDTADAINAHIIEGPEAVDGGQHGHGFRMPWQRQQRHVVGELIDRDLVSKRQRMLLTALILLLLTAYVSVCSTYFRQAHYLGANLGRYLGFFIPMFLGGVLAARRGRLAQAIHWRPAKEFFVMAAWLAIAFFATTPMLRAAEPPTWFLGSVPLLFINWKRHTSPTRDTRLNLTLVMLGAISAAIVAGFMRADVVAGMGLAIGSIFAAQMLSPFHRLSPVDEARNPAARDYRRKQSASSNSPPTLDERPMAAASFAQPLGSSSAELIENAAAAPEPTAKRENANEVQSDSALESSQHSQMTVLLLNLVYFVFPVGGLHRIVVGRVVSGIIWLLTGGLFFVGQIYDAYMIITGQFTDAEGRVVGPVRQTSSTPVNHLSSVPATTRFRFGAMMLNAIGTTCLFLACGAIVASIGFTTVSYFEIDKGLSFDGLAALLGGHDWPEAMHLVAVIVAIAFTVIGAVSFMFARRDCNKGHIFRALFGCICIAVALGVTYNGFEDTRWNQASEWVAEGPIRALNRTFLDEDFLAIMGAAVLTGLTGAAILAWPSRERQLPTEKQA